MINFTRLYFFQCGNFDVFDDITEQLFSNDIEKIQVDDDHIQMIDILHHPISSMEKTNEKASHKVQSHTEVRTYIFLHQITRYLFVLIEIQSFIVNIFKRTTTTKTIKSNKQTFLKRILSF